MKKLIFSRISHRFPTATTLCCTLRGPTYRRLATKIGEICGIAVVAILLWSAGPACAKPGNAENGAEVYAAKCVWCHGEEGDGEGPAAERLNPPPRDFTSAQYKIKTTAFEDDFANDDNMFRMIRDGMPGTAMPGWSDVLSEQ